MAKVTDYKYKADMAVSSLVVNIILFVVLYIVAWVAYLVESLIAYIPIIGWIFVAIAFPITLILEITFRILIALSLFGVIFSKAHITEDGIVGRDNRFRSFNYTYDQITKVESKGKTIIITATNLLGKEKKHKIIGKNNAEEFKGMYYLELDKSKENPKEDAFYEA